MIPFETNALELDKTSLKSTGPSDTPEKPLHSVAQDPNTKSDKGRIVEEDQVSGSVASQEEISDKIEEIKESVIDEKAEGGKGEGENIADSSGGESAPYESTNQAEKGDTGVLDDFREKFEDRGSNSEHEIFHGNLGQRKHSLKSSESLHHKIDDQMGGSSSNEPKSETDKEAMLHGPKNVICNAAGCFSSLEELDMFNELASQVRSNLEELNKIEKSAIEERGTDVDASFERTEDGNDDGEPIPNLR